MKSSPLENISLPEPKLTGGMSLMEALKNRHTQRDFSSDKYMSLQQVSECLWCAYGNNRESEHGKKTVASAVNMCSLTLFVFMKNGVYKYNPEKKLLEFLIKGDLREKTGKQDFVKNANLNIVFMQDLNINSPYKEFNLNIEEKKRCCDIDAGHCTQNIYLYAASQGLKCVERGMADEKILKEVLGLGDNFRLVITISVGH